MSINTTERSPEFYKNRCKVNDKFVTLYGEPFMKVMPVPSLMTSKTLSQAVARGDWLVVNMNTGELTVYSKQRQDRDKAVAEAAERIEPEVILTRADGGQVRLTKYVAYVVTQLRQQAHASSLLGCTVHRVDVDPRYNASIVYYSETLDFVSFLQKVKALYN